MSAERHKNQTHRQKNVIKGTKNVSFLHGQQKIRVLALGIITFTRQEVTLLSEELLYTRKACLTPLLCTLDGGHLYLKGSIPAICMVQQDYSLSCARLHMHYSYVICATPNLKYTDHPVVSAPLYMCKCNLHLSW